MLTMRDAMKKLSLFGIAAIFTSTLALAQPPEEVPPPLPETSETVVAPEAVSTPAPVAEPKLAAPAAAPEDKRMKGIELSPNVRLIPIGYDSINITGNEDRYYLGVKPSIDISTSFKTTTDKTIDFSAGYAMEWREYYNKASTRRDFDNDVTASLGLKWSELLKTTLDMEFEYFFKTGTDDNQDNSIAINMIPMMTFTATKELGFKFGYEFWFINILNWPVGPDGAANPPTDLDEFRRGSFTSDATGFDNFDTSALDAINGLPSSYYSNQSVHWVDNRLVAGVSYKFPTGTKVGFDYKYKFAQISNLETMSLTGHFLIPSITQSLPWKGGTISLKDELRLQMYDSALADAKLDPNIKKQDFRNRVTLSANQDINDYMSAELYYRLEIKGKNADDYEKIAKNHNFYLGMNFKF